MSRMQLKSCTSGEWQAFVNQVRELQDILQRLTHAVLVKLRGSVPSFIDGWANCVGVYMQFERFTCVDEGTYYTMKSHVDYIEGSLKQWLSENTAFDYKAIEAQPQQSKE